jgi:serine phosphatase RsbU (regulator of sigma subunit)
MIKADDYDNLWISSKDNGLFVITGDSTQEAGMSFVLQYNASDGLLSNYCYGVSVDNKNNIWVTHDGGVSKFDKESGEFKYYNEQDGLNISFSESAISNWENELWFGTDNGIVRYNADEEFINKIPPITSIKKIKINDQLKNITDQINLPFGEYDVEFLFNGLSLRKSDEVTYEFRLIGYEEKWSDKLTQNSTKYPKLSDGEYVFQVRSYNSDGIMGDVVEFKIFIEIPFWKKWWFYLSIFILVIILVTLVIKLRERNLIKYQKTLENQLALRTKEVVNQKEKIEEINKDLTDSINYAKRIQIQVLPEKEHFDSILPSSFVLYKPKDIVSGDFFWIKEIGDEIILVCADCTGHGVPGGFMSMIGSILIHEAIVFHKKLDPADIIKEIDVNIKTVLHQKDDYESNKDGMDLAIISINKKTGKLKFSGAMRPCHIYRNGSINILSGDRYSIGGFALANKEYTTKEFQLKKGDFIYLFSDGYADQFGGEKVRKLKMSGFNELLDQLASAPMDGQYKIASNFLKNWMGDHSQMDDILLMGLEYL